jgi:metal-sulfur cluster biosynthetic enzyme
MVSRFTLDWFPFICVTSAFVCVPRNFARITPRVTGVPFPYSGDAALGPVITQALHRVIDPEMSLDILELGLVYGVEAREGRVDVRLTMTSAACPVAELIVDEVEHELRQALGAATQVNVEVCWDPPWSPERMSERARAAMDWD